MRSFILFSTIIIVGLCATDKPNKRGKEEVIVSLEQALVASLKKSFPEILQALVTKINLENYPGEGYVNTDLNATVIARALNNLRDILPERIPLIPLAVAQPIPEYNLLLYFAESNSSFVNLTQYNPEVTVNSTKSNVTIGINLHVNSSGLEGHYELDISNSDMHLFGDGNYSIASTDTLIAVMTEIQLFPDYSFQMSYFHANLSCNNSKLEMSNLLNGDPEVQPVVDFLGETMPEDVSAFSDMMFADINNTVVYLTNSYLADMFSWDQIVWLIQCAAELDNDETKNT